MLRDRFSGERRKICKTDDEIIFTLESIITTAESIKSHTVGCTKEEFLSNEVVRGYVAMMFSVIGNHCGMLPTEIRETSSYLDASYDFRCVIDHTYYTEAFSNDILWDAYSRDLDKIIHDAKVALNKVKTKQLKSYSPKRRIASRR